MTGTCVQCSKATDALQAVQGEPTDRGLCPECLARALLSPAARKKLDVAGKKAARQTARANQGMPTEARVLEAAARLRELGIRLDKVPTPWRIIGRSGAFARCVPAETAIVDFVGHDEHGRALAIEAKSVTTVDARFYVRLLRPQQREYLDGAARAGARAFLLVDFPGVDGGCWYLLPWDVAREWTRVAPEDGIEEYRADREWLLATRPADGRAA